LLPAGFQLDRARALLAEPDDLTVDDIQEFIVLYLRARGGAILRAVREPGAALSRQHAADQRLPGHLRSEDSIHLEPLAWAA
jgi:hypothetical protein